MNAPFKVLEKLMVKDLAGGVPPTFSSSGIKVDNITINSPEISPNTDGIHLQNTKDVEIHHSSTGCGMNLLGGLGKDKSVACVSDIAAEKNLVTKYSMELE
ncbi:hypothetical protein OIU78_004218 [Salix suchowensis]|nr:hypothetical protein OIU78_004218 [Salix suchowensis]